MGDASTGSPGWLLIIGEPGVGKTALLRHAQTQAVGWTVLACSGVALERDLPFAGLQQLIRPLSRNIENLLTSEQAATLRSALALGPASLGGRLGVAAACLELLAATAEDRPLLITVDDMQWLDAPTVEALDFVGRRLRTEKIVVVATSRELPGPSAPLHAAPRLSLTGLAPAEAQTLLTRMGFNGTGPQLALLAESTGGNPLALSQAAADPSRVPLLAAGAPASIGPTLEAVYAQTFADLGPSSSAALLVLAAADRERSDVIDVACRQLGHDPTALERPEVLGLIERTGSVLQFSHPLARAAHYNTASPADRRRAHRALGEAIMRLDPDAWIRSLQHQVLAAERPDEDLAAGLESAGVDAATRRAYSSAVDLLLQAADLSPLTSAGHRRRLLAARLAMPAGRLREAAQLTATLPVEPPDVRAEVVHLQARLSIWTGHPRSAIDGLVGLADSGTAPEPALLLAEASLAALMVGEQRRGVALAEAAVSKIESDRDAAPAWLIKAFALTGVNHLAEAQTCLNRGLPLIDTRPGEQWPLIAGVALFGLRQLDRAANLLDAAISSARSASAVETMPMPLGLQALVEVQRGNWAKAALLASEGLAAADALGGEISEGIRRSTCEIGLALLEALRGEASKCRTRVRSVLSAADIAAEPIAAAHAERVLGLLALGSGDHLVAAAHFGKVYSSCHAAGIEESPFLPYLADLIEARAGIDKDPGQVGDLLDELRTTAAKAGTPRDTGLYQRCLSLATTDLDRRLEAALEAVRLLDTAGDPFEAARARLLAGETLRRAKRRADAATWLAEAATTFGALNAEPWLTRCNVELRASGVAPQKHRSGARAGAGDHHLTAQERQVAVLASDGLSNAEIAGRLFLSSKTIEFHLGNAYRKLGIRRRSELPSAMRSVERH
jgi:DNA-binding CsgD family transcriptional regulator